MPRPILPPTPQSSVDLPPKPPPSLSSLELAFTLPPPALGSIASSTSAPPTTLPKPSYDVPSSPASSNYTPSSPLDVTKSASNAAAPLQSKKRRRASTLENPKSQPLPKQKPTAPAEAIILPPPPTRNRKIIQMKPRQPSTSSASSSTQPSSAPEPKTKPKRAAAGPKSDKLAEDGKPTTAVGRKIARKTAHSLIERRRRFKMNEEFGVLKGMIPACTGVEMHKLAILQASIEYLKYLEQCVVDLKASNSAATHQNQLPVFRPGGYDNGDDEEDEDDEDDEEMTEPTTAHEIFEEHQEPTGDSPTSEKSNSNQIQMEEPAPKYSAYVAPEPASPYLHSTKSQHSPAEPQHPPAYFPSHPMSTAASPNLFPQHSVSASERGHDHVDAEATHALLLLADGSRRSSEATHTTSPERKGRGMSVKDLLSS